MLKYRRDAQAAAIQSREAEAPWSDDPYADLSRHLDARGGPSDAELDDLAAQLEAELHDGFFDPAVQGQPLAPRGRGPLDPVRFDEVGAPMPRGYDQWDDDALDQLAGELAALDDFAPQGPDHGVLPPHADAETEAAPAAGGRRLPPRAIAASVIALIAAGAIGWAVTGDGPLIGGTPVHVAAPATPYKIVPKEGDTIDEPVDAANAVFDPAAGDVPPKGEERLLAREEEVPDLPGVTPQVNRVILPDGQEIVTEEQSPAEAGPRRVRTVLVRPDGTILEAPDRPVRAMPSPTDPVLATDPSPIEEAIAQADPEIQSSAGLPPLSPSNQQEAAAPAEAPMPGAPAAAPVQNQPDPLAVLASGADDTPAPPAAMTEAAPSAPPAMEPAPAAAAAGDDPIAVLAASAPMPPEKPAAPAEPVAAAPAAEPVQVASTAPIVPEEPAPAASAPAETETALAPATEPAAAEPAPAAPAAAYVQLSSQRTEAAALSAFRALQAKHPGILGGLAPDLQKADLGAKGIYYRVRVGQASREAAVSLCESLKGAGADCLIARR